MEKPTHSYKNLRKVLLDDKLQVLDAFCGSVLVKQKRDDQNNSVRYIIDVFEGFGKTVHLLHWAITKEIEEYWEDNFQIFRGESQATLLMDAFLKLVAKPFVKRMIGSCVEEFIERKIPLEVDPARVGKAESESCAKILVQYAQRIIDSIIESEKSCPNSLRVLFNHVKTSIKKISPRDWHLGVGALVFLRCICPALVAPEDWNIVTEPPTPNTRRGLILMSKLLQNLASGVEFGTKEPFMVRFNPFISTNSQSVKAYLSSISDVSNKSQGKENKSKKRDDNSKLNTPDNNNDSGNNGSKPENLRCFSITRKRRRNAFDNLIQIFQNNLSSITELLPSELAHELTINITQYQNTKYKESSSENTTSSTESTSNPLKSTQIIHKDVDDKENKKGLYIKLKSIELEIQGLQNDNKKLSQENHSLKHQLNECDTENITSFTENTILNEDMKKHLSEELQKFVATTLTNDLMEIIEQNKRKAMMEVKEYAKSQMQKVKDKMKPKHRQIEAPHSHPKPRRAKTQSSSKTQEKTPERPQNTVRPQSHRHPLQKTPEYVPLKHSTSDPNLLTPRCKMKNELVQTKPITIQEFTKQLDEISKMFQTDNHNNV